MRRQRMRYQRNLSRISSRSWWKSTHSTTLSDYRVLFCKRDNKMKLLYHTSMQVEQLDRVKNHIEKFQLFYMMYERLFLCTGLLSVTFKNYYRIKLIQERLTQKKVHLNSPNIYTFYHINEFLSSCSEKKLGEEKSSETFLLSLIFLVVVINC